MSSKMVPASLPVAGQACGQGCARALQVRDAERRSADVLLNAMVSLLCQPDASMADNIAGQAPGAGGLRLEGKLALTLALVQVRTLLPSCVHHRTLACSTFVDGVS